MQDEKRRGRPPGARNKPKVPSPTLPNTAYHHADPSTMIARNLALIDRVQIGLQNEWDKAFAKDPGRFFATREEVQQLQALANALVRTIEALKKSSDLADELAKRMTPQQLLEAAVRKLEGQDAATIRYFIKRLRASLELLGPVTERQDVVMGMTATDAIASLDEDE